MSDAAPTVKRVSPRRWFHFSLRTLFVALTIACLWLGFEVTQARRQRAAVQSLEKLGAYVAYDYDEPGTQYESGGAPPRLRTLSSTKQWIADWLGKDYVATAIRVSISSPTVTDESLVPLAELSELEAIHLEGCMLVTDATLRNLPSSTRIAALTLSGTSISDAGLMELDRFPNLAALDVDGTRITDAGLESVGKRTRLTFLDLSNTRVTDVGMSHLTGLTRMRTLMLLNNKLGDESFRAIGNCRDLEGLLVDGAHVTDAGLAYLSQLTKLNGIWLKNTQIQGAGLKHLAQNKALSVVRLNGCPLNDEAATALASLPGLFGVDVSRSTMSVEAMGELKTLRPKVHITPP